MTAALIVEHRRLPPRVRPDPVALIREAVERLRDVPRESTASMPDMLFHNRRVAKAIAEAADRLEVEYVPVAARSSRAAAVFLPAPREQRREIVSTKGRRVRVVERGACGRQMEFEL